MELSFASRKLKYKKMQLKWKLFIVEFLVFVITLGLYTIFHIGIMKGWISSNNKVVTFSILIGSFCIFLIFVLCLTHFLLYRRLNRDYNKFYFSLLQDEASLEGLILFNSDSSISNEELKTLEEFNGVKDMVIDEALTQTSSSAYFDLLSLHYEKTHFGVIIKTKIDMAYSDIIQLRNDGRRGTMEYNQKKVKQYGVGTSYSVKEFAIYSSMSTEIYKIMKEDIIEDLYNFSSFCRCPLVLTIIEDNIFIFIDGWKMHLLHSLKEKDELSIIDVQIEALKMLQSYIEKINLIAQKKGEVDING